MVDPELELVAVTALRLRQLVGPGDGLDLQVSPTGDAEWAFELRRGSDLASKGVVASGRCAAPGGAVVGGAAGGERFPAPEALIPHRGPALLLAAVVEAANWEFRALETLLKGKEIPLPRHASFADSDGIVRRHIRVRWWDRGATSYRDAFLGTESVATAIPEDDIAGDHLVEYSHDDVPVFMGHYWLTGKPAPLAPNIACLDYSVAKPGGKLVAYRWDGERTLQADKFVAVTAVEFALTETL